MVKFREGPVPLPPPFPPGSAPENCLICQTNDYLRNKQAFSLVIHELYPKVLYVKLSHWDRTMGPYHNEYLKPT